MSLLFSEAAKYYIGTNCIGGQLGECPTWLVGSIFYLGDKLLTTSGIDKNSAREKIEEAKKICETYGLVFAIDLIIPSPELLDEIITFAGELDVPLFIDSPDSDIRAKAYLKTKDYGLNRIAIANGLYVDSGENELNALAESGIENVVLMAFDPKDPYSSIEPSNRVMILRKLLDTASRAKAKNILVDTVVLDPSSIYLSGEAIYQIRRDFKLPAGSAPANALGNVSKDRFSIEEMIGIHGGAAAFLRMVGADFIMYGPVSRVKYVAPVVAMIDSMLGYGLRRRGVRIEGTHPSKTLLRRVQQSFTKR
ncbi:tetrahydromethanopterin S-methyltransferase subunit H [Thermogladius sp. 4427co]|uniref:tetrahydromethanopterin S-methyltransferase subunit H n=1 Tax=Thermogladius sp. 4427co TaxID=3450718 RepID=UPI003F79E0CE